MGTLDEEFVSPLLTFRTLLVQNVDSIIPLASTADKASALLGVPSPSSVRVHMKSLRWPSLSAVPTEAELKREFNGTQECRIVILCLSLFCRNEGGE